MSGSRAHGSGQQTALLQGKLKREAALQQHATACLLLLAEGDVARPRQALQRLQRRLARSVIGARGLRGGGRAALVAAGGNAEGGLPAVHLGTGFGAGACGSGVRVQCCAQCISQTPATLMSYAINGACPQLLGRALALHSNCGKLEVPHRRTSGIGSRALARLGAPRRRRARAQAAVSGGNVSGTHPAETWGTKEH